MNIYLAIDAGGTKTDYLLADDRQELARVRSGTIKRMRADAATTMANLDQALTELTRLTGITMESVATTCIGTAGEKVPLVTDWLRAAFAERVPGGFLLLGDVEIALDAAFPGEPGVLVLAGTGSNVAGRDHTGALTTAGGWGPALADQGSGHRIGQEALRAMFLAIDEGRSTALLPAVLEHWKLDDMTQIVEVANRNPAPDFSRLTESVLRAAEQGDSVASAVLRDEGEALAHLACLVIRRLQLASATSGPDGPWTPSVTFAGSIMEKVAPLRNALIASLRRSFPGVHILGGVVDPIAGALWRARRGR